MNIKEILQHAEEIFATAKLENPRLNAGLIIEEVVGLKRLSLPLYYQQEITSAQEKQALQWIARRAKHEPLQYIFGYTEFYGYRINVTPDVLIPRPETEFLIETIQHKIMNPPRILDIGTGSGAIAISLKKLFPESEVVAVDISQQALELAQANAKLNNVEINFVEADIYSAELGKFDLIVSNPPYVTDDEYAQLPGEVQKFEPKLALVGTENGLYFYRKILEISKMALQSQGVIFFEIGESQAVDIRKIAKAEGFGKIEVIRDLAGKERIMMCR